MIDEKEVTAYCNVFAKIRAEELADFYKEAKKVWHGQGGIVTTELTKGA